MISEQTNSTPAGYTTVAPWVVTDDTGAFLDFVSQTFGGEELARVPTEDGLIGHGEIRVGDTVVLAFDRHTNWPTMPSLLRVFVTDADQAFHKPSQPAAMSSRLWPTTPSDSAEAVSRTPSAISGG
ncbi:putative glyoxalase superfamily protein PhnB [Streptomyces sp. SFB5A]|uniref:Putative glyoxalase superfamily protein PhnB n=1 Tax=Streptomyces nymphaeiformis TaxID=2663842 RepID=A0A7W7U003_9ACTN|nr:putative glyoxalase superfamily protein PhnB [Streptomyces nymphaeiformis]